ncbi:hypothetical protein ACI2KR_06815 [Pseudomonas luteola]
MNFASTKAGHSDFSQNTIGIQKLSELLRDNFLTKDPKPFDRDALCDSLTAQGIDVTKIDDDDAEMIFLSWEQYYDEYCPAQGLLLSYKSWIEGDENHAPDRLHLALLDTYCKCLKEAL